MHKALQKIFTNRLDKQSEINWQYFIEYGPYLHNRQQFLSEDFYKLILQKVISYICPSSQILDVGCGLGRITMDIANLRSGNVIGVDKNSSYIKEARAIADSKRLNIVTYNLPTHCEFLVADALSLPWPKDTFDFITSINLIDRVSNPKKVIDETLRVLKKNGILVITTPYDWQEQITGKISQIDDLKQLFETHDVNILEEVDNIPFEIAINPRRKTSYLNHLLVIQKK